jgi:predicted transcriptional regulator YheO
MKNLCYSLRQSEKNFMKKMKAKASFEILAKHEALIEAIVELFHPFVEAAVHDLKNGKILKIYNNLSRRKEGDPSPLQEFKVRTEEFPDYFPSYYKENWDGRKLKCTSITLRDEDGSPVGLICFNFDTTPFRGVQEMLESFLRVRQETSKNPIEIFGEDWQLQVSNSIQEYLIENKLSLVHLTREEKKSLVKYLYHKGIFNFKNAPGIIAQKLNISRASIYNYLE